MTGQRDASVSPLAAVDPEDVAIAQILSQEGYVSGLISDTYHYRAPRNELSPRFPRLPLDSWQEYDPYVSAPLKRNLNDYLNENFPNSGAIESVSFWQTPNQFAGPGDWFAHTVVDEAVSGLRITVT